MVDREDEEKIFSVRGILRIVNQNEVTNPDGEIQVLDESIYDDTVKEARNEEVSNIEDITECTHREEL